MKIMIFIILILLFIAFLLHYAGQVDAECGYDTSCKQPKICQCERIDDSGFDDFVQRIKLYNRPIVKSDEEPFYIDVCNYSIYVIHYNIS
jgi:hypothetical protein